jgi:hypothetical protein
MTYYVDETINSYVDPETGYSTLDTYNMITDMKFGSTKHIPSQTFPTLPTSDTSVKIFRNHDSGENYGTVASAYGGTCGPQKYYVGKCPTNQFIRNLSENPKPTPTPKPSMTNKNDILLIEVIIEEGLTGQPVYQVNTSAVPSWLKTSLQNAVGKVPLPPIYANRNPKSKSPNDFIFYQVVKKKLKAIPITLPQIQLVRKVPRQVSNTNAEVIGKMQYTYDEPMGQPPMTQGPSPMTQGPSPMTQRPSPMIQRPSPMAQRPSPMAQRPSPMAQRAQQMNQGGPPPSMAQGVQPMNQ